MTILAAMKLDDAAMNVVQRNDHHRHFEGVFSNSKSLLAFYPGNSGNAVEGRYVLPGAIDFQSVGQVVFRPGGFHVQARGISNVRAVECWLDEARMATFNRLMPRWTEDRLRRTLDIRASQLSTYLLRLRQEVMRPTLAAQAVVDALLVILLNDLAVHLAEDPALDVSERGWGHSGAVKRVVERIMDVAEVTPTVGELAEMTALSERHLLRVFKDAKGVSLVEFIRKARLERARQLLASTDLPLKEVAYRLGFSSHASFTTAFGREMNVTPCGYRRENRRSVYAPGRV